MLCLSFHIKEITLLIIIFTWFPRKTTSYTCNAPFAALDYMNAQIYMETICNQIDSGTKYRLDGSSSLKCFSSTNGDLILNDPDPIPFALCSKSTTVTPGIFLVEGSETCLPGSRLLTIQEANNNFGDICDNMLDSADDFIILKLQDDWVFKNWGWNGYDCEVLEEPGTMTGDCLCIYPEPVAKEIHIVSSGEPSCSAPCATCDSNGCTSCQPSDPLLYLNNCYSTCPPGTFVSGSVCNGKN